MRGATRVEPEHIKKLLRAALEGGADFADVYFEYRRSRSFVMEDGRVRTVGGGVDLGVGIRAVKGEAVGYAYAESLELDSMLRAATTAGQIARAGRRKRVSVERRRVRAMYRPTLEVVDMDGADCVALLRRADKAARKVSRKIVRVDASLAAVHKEVLVASSDGAIVFDEQPMVRMGVSAAARAKGRTEQGSSGGGGRFGLEYFDAHTPESHGEEAARVAAWAEARATNVSASSSADSVRPAAM